MMQSSKVVSSSIQTDPVRRKYSTPNPKSFVSYNEISLQPAVCLKKISLSTDKINEPISTLLSTTSDLNTYNENIDSCGLSLLKSYDTEDPVYSDPLDALEKETDGCIYDSPECKNSAISHENIYEETTHPSLNQNNKITLQPLIESDHESSDSSSTDSPSFSSSISSGTRAQFHGIKSPRRSKDRRKSSLDYSLTNLSQLDNLFADDNGNVIVENTEQKKVAEFKTVIVDRKNSIKSNSLSMEDLSHENGQVGHPLGNVRKTSISSCEGRQNKKKRKSSINSISIKRRDKGNVVS